MRQRIRMLPKATQSLINKMTDAEYKKLRHRFDGLLRTRALEPENHAQIALEAKAILEARSI